MARRLQILGMVFFLIGAALIFGGARFSLHSAVPIEIGYGLLMLVSVPMLIVTSWMLEIREDRLSVARWRHPLVMTSIVASTIAYLSIYLVWLMAWRGLLVPSSDFARGFGQAVVVACGISFCTALFARGLTRLAMVAASLSCLLAAAFTYGVMY